MSEFYNEKIVHKSRKDHKCDICDDVISAGSTYKKIAGYFDDHFFNTNVCEHCIPILHRFFDLNRDDLGNGYTYDEVSEDIWEQIGTECPDKDECIRNCIKCEYAVKKYLEI